VVISSIDSEARIVTGHLAQGLATMIVTLGIVWATGYRADGCTRGHEQPVHFGDTRVISISARAILGRRMATVRMKRGVVDGDTGSVGCDAAGSPACSTYAGA
jgi:hypothetical protein